MPRNKSRKSRTSSNTQKHTKNSADDTSLVEILQQGLEFHRQNRLTEAEERYRTVLKYDPNNANALQLLGVSYAQRENHEEAIRCYDRAIENDPNFAGTYNNRGISHSDTGNYKLAVDSFKQALELNPDDSDALCNLGNALSKLGEFSEAKQYYLKSIKLNPNQADTHYNIGRALAQENSPDEAEKYYRQALVCKPDHIGALNNLGNYFRERKEYQQALSNFKRVLELDPDHTNAYREYTFTLRLICDWSNYRETAQTLAEWNPSRHPAPTPFSMLMWLDDPQAQQICSRAYTKSSLQEAFQPLNAAPPYDDGKIKVAYLSADFREHPVAILTAELFELHDRNKFEITAIAYGEPDSSPMRQRLIDAFDHFIEVDDMTDQQIAELLVSKGIHIAVDLAGHTRGARSGVLARRPAPIQISYLGFIGTTGADFIDYILVDEFCVPADQQPYFDEKLVQLPCYMVNDTRREIASATPTRAECGLPEEGVVFCCFNNSYKITPDIFDIWMRILNQVPGSVLWLIGDNELVRQNLRGEAGKRGIDPDRLVFAGRADYPDHLARQRLADLFLDTLPYNAGTTASDALWVGLPVITCSGKSFVSRMGGSLLQAVELPELITASLENYEATAIELANNPQKLAGLRRRLIQNRDTTPLFNSKIFCKNLEEKFIGMVAEWDSKRTILSARTKISEKNRKKADKLFKKASTVHRQNQIAEARDLYNKILELDPHHTNTLINLGHLYADQNDYDNAISCYRRSIGNDPSSATLYNDLGIALYNSEQYNDALSAFNQAVELDPDNGEVYSNLGSLYGFLEQSDDAIKCLTTALKLTPDNFDAHYNLGVALGDLRHFDRAKEHYLSTLKLQPNHTGALHNLGIIYTQEKDHIKARELFEREIELSPENANAVSQLAICTRQLCDWSNFSDLRERLANWHKSGKTPPNPFSLLMWLDDPEAQQFCNRAHTHANVSSGFRALNAIPAYDGGKIKVAYLSADFREHPIAYLTAQLFELHDRNKFEITAIAYGKPDFSPMRQRLVNAFDHFIEVDHLSDRQIAELIGSKGVHVAVDLMGYTSGARPGVLARRPAPIQISYLGFIGSMGAEFIDYILVDKFCVPADQQSYFDEELVQLPCYMVNDTRREISSATPTRTECGLPERGFVFCCFNNSYKITPETFDCWMRILNQIPESVLWLIGDNESTKQNLCTEAEKRGIDSGRLVFAERIDYPEHLARQRLADLFLDTFPYNAGTTASDALWVGLPVLTCPGRSFVSRMGGSLLHAVGLPELIAGSHDAYETKAIELARDPQKLESLRKRLIGNRDTAPLFDCAAFCRNLEETFIGMVEKLYGGFANSVNEKEMRNRKNSSSATDKQLEHAVALHKSGKLQEAEKIYLGVLESDPANDKALHMLGLICTQRGEHQRALEYIEKSLEYMPGNTTALINLGVVYHNLGDYAAARLRYEEALALAPNHPEALFNLGLAYADDKDRQLAEKFYQECIKHNPDHYRALNNLGVLYKTSNRYDKAFNCFSRAQELSPDDAYINCQTAFSSRQLCDWSEYEQTSSRLKEWRKSRVTTPNPFIILSWFDDPELQQLISRAHISTAIDKNIKKIDARPSLNAEKIKIAYFSVDFRVHPVAFLTAELFELHDREKFEVFAIAYGKPDSSSVRERLINAFDHFVDVEHMSDGEIAEFIASQGIHIIIDLTGHTQGSRPNVLAARPAPVQISYLGYIGTMGCDFIDYILVDEFSVPPDQQSYFDEELVHLPCYMVNDSKREMSPNAPSRAECGLPEEGFVFCSFNNSYKITPAIFDLWMRIINSVTGSVLWLVGDNEIARHNLRFEAECRGVDPTRLIFASRVEYPVHLARQRHADLFLDTLPYNAGTTASDALWVGLPVVTCSGKSFVSRMGGSLLHAVGLSELIADSLNSYEMLAIELASNPQRLREVRQRLIDSRDTALLFDSKKFCRELESRLLTMVDAWKNGKTLATYSAKTKPDTVSHHRKIESLFEEAVSLHRQQNVTEAEKLYLEIIGRSPDHDNAYHYLGVLRAQQGNHSDAIELYRRAIEINPDSSALYNNLGVSLRETGNYEGASRAFLTATDISPDNIDALFNLGGIYGHLNRLSDAEKSFLKILSISPAHGDAHYCLGVIYYKTERPDEALPHFEKSLKTKPDNIDALLSTGLIFSHKNLLNDAAKYFRRILALSPDHPYAHYNLGLIYKINKMLDEAFHHFQIAGRTAPDYIDAFNELAMTSRQLCDWSNYKEAKKVFENPGDFSDGALNAFTNLIWSDDPERALNCARRYSRSILDKNLKPINATPLYNGGKIKIAYISADLREHPVSYLTAELFELHDRSRFEVTAISYGEPNNSPMRRRLINAFDHFIEVGNMTDSEVAELIASRDIHIAVDLMGHTQGARLGVLARRPAPIQVNYLGYIGTMGCEFIDYILVDEFCVPSDQQPYFDEELVPLNCYMVNDTKREISPVTPTRAKCGLPEEGFVFSCFNNGYKITPEIFDLWMHILDQVPGSVLWLVGGNDTEMANLRSEAGKRGVDSERLVFANRINYADHLARQRLSDLFLDTLPYNAGTTASDALWVGVPVLTCPGSTFVSRMGGSLLHAVGLPELIVSSLEEYAEKAIELANNRGKLDALRSHLSRNRKSLPLFNSKAFCEDLENKYINMITKYANSNRSDS